MPYALRNQKNEIVALTGTPNIENDQKISFTDPDVLHFLANSSLYATRDTTFNKLLADDLGTIRIVEDLIDLLVAKGVILFSELPVGAQKKLLAKKMLRDVLNRANDIIVDDSIPFL